VKFICGTVLYPLIGYSIDFQCHTVNFVPPHLSRIHDHLPEHKVFSSNLCPTGLIYSSASKATLIYVRDCGFDCHTGQSFSLFLFGPISMTWAYARSSGIWHFSLPSNWLFFCITNEQRSQRIWSRPCQGNWKWNLGCESNFFLTLYALKRISDFFVWVLFVIISKVSNFNVGSSHQQLPISLDHQTQHQNSVLLYFPWNRALQRRVWGSVKES